MSRWAWLVAFVFSFVATVAFAQTAPQAPGTAAQGASASGPSSARPSAPSAPKSAPAASVTAPGRAAASATGEATRAAPPNPHTTVNPHAGTNPHAAMGPHGQITPDSSQVAPDLPPGTIEAAIVDTDGRPIPGADVRLAILSQKISEGEQHSEKLAKSDAEGRVRFTALATTNDKSYRVVVRSGEAEFGSNPFSLRDNAGQRVLLHVYPYTSDMAKTIVFGTFVSIEPREDVFQLDVILHVFNVSRTAWVAKGVVIELPEGFKAFSASDPVGDVRFEGIEGRGASLRGTFPPGQDRSQFRFQIPKTADSEASFSIGLPDRVAQAQVVAASNPEMTLEVAGGFPQAEVRKSEDGTRVLVTMRMIKRGEPTIRKLDVTLTGLRVPSAGRWVAVAIALVFAGLGGLAAKGDLHLASVEKVQSDRARARELIVQELVLVERAKEAGELGPNAYDRAHRALLDALARIGIPEEKKAPKKRRAAKA
jgi:hypothetical protein